MFQSNIVLSTLFLICFISKPLLTEAAPGAESDQHHQHRMCKHSRHKNGPPATTHEDPVIDQEVIDSIFKSPEGSVFGEVITEATTTLADGDETTNNTNVKPPNVRLRTILSAKETCQQGQKRDRKGRCRTVINSMVN